MSVTIDPRRQDAVLFDLGAVVTAEGSAFASTVTLVRQLREIGVGTAVFSSDNCQDVLASAGIGDLFAVHGDRLLEAADHLGGGRADASSSRPTRRASRPDVTVASRWSSAW